MTGSEGARNDNLENALKTWVIDGLGFYRHNHMSRKTFKGGGKMAVFPSKEWVGAVLVAA